MNHRRGCSWLHYVQANGLYYHLNISNVKFKVGISVINDICIKCFKLYNCLLSVSWFVFATEIFS